MGNAGQQAFLAPCFYKIVEGAGLQALHGFVRRIHAGENNDQHVGMGGADVAQELLATDIGHGEIQQDQADIFFVKDPQRLTAV